MAVCVSRVGQRHPEAQPTADDVRRILSGTSLRLVFQPIVDLRRGTVAGYECLTRFDGPPQASPDAWFAAAGPAGLSEDLESWVVRQALTHRCELPANTFLSINVSPGYLVSPGFAAVLEGADDLSRVVVEVTEDVALPADPALQRALARVRSCGALIAVDDAGTGYAGLAQLLALRPQLVKLDRELIRGLHRDEARYTLAELVGELAGRLDAWLLAEGIETVEELDACISLGIPLGQGDLLGAPTVPFAEMPADLSARIAARSRAASLRETVRSLLEDAVTAPDPQRGRALLTTGLARDVMVVDAAGRPVTQLAPAVPHGVAPLVVSPSTPVTDAALRAMNRPLPQRFLPVTVTTGRGQLLGVVRMERLVNRLVQQVQTPGTTPASPSAGAALRRGELVKEFRCGDVVPGCTATFAAADEEGILAEVAVHAERDHQIHTLSVELVDAVRGAILTR